MNAPFIPAIRPSENIIGKMTAKPVDENQRPPFTAKPSGGKSGAESKRPERRLLRDLAIYAAMMLLFVLLLHGALFTSEPLCLGEPFGDGATQFYPWRVFGFGEWSENRLPLWNPYSLMGMPFVAALQSAMLYPPNWLCLVMPAHQAVNLNILLHLFFSALFTWLLARRLDISRAGSCVAALTFALAANHVFRIYQGHWNHIAAMPWIPLTLLSVEMLARTGRLRFVALGAAALGLQILAGNPQITYYTCLFAVIYLLLRAFIAWLDLDATIRQSAARCGWFAMMVAGGLLLSAVQLVPALELVSISSRSEYITFDWLTQYSLPPEGLLTLFAPNLFGPVFMGGEELLPYWGRWNFWEVGAYMGIVSFALAAVGIIWSDRRRWLPFALPAALLLFIAMARYMPFAEELFQVVPGLGLFRAHGRAVSVAGLGIALAAGMGLDALIFSARADRRDAAWGFAIIAGIAAAVAAAAFASGRLPDFWKSFFVYNVNLSERPYLAMPDSPDWDFASRAWVFARWGIVRSAGFLCAAATLTVISLRRLLNARWAAAGIVILAAADLYLFASPFIFTFDTRDRIWDEQTRARLAEIDEPFRVSSRDDWYRYACDPMILRMASLEGIEPNVPARFHEFFWTMQGTSPETVRTVYALRSRNAPHLDLVNLRFVVSRNPEGGYRIAERPGAMPRAFLVHEYVPAEHRFEALGLLQMLDFRRVAVLEDAPRYVIRHRPEASPPPSEGAHARIESYEPMRVRIRAHTPRSALLVLSDLYYPGWRATVNGREVPVLQANYLMRAVEIQPGDHVVEFEYRPRSFALGRVIGMISWGALGLTLLLRIIAGIAHRQHEKVVVAEAADT